MATTRETGNRGRSCQRRLAVPVGGFLLALCVTGCSGGPSHLAGDPLFGEFGLKQQGPSSPPPASGSSRTQAGVPPIPATPFSSSPAALAAAPLPGARPLAIDGSRQQGNIIPTSGANVGLTPIVQPVPRENAGPAGVVPAKNTWAAPAPLAGEAAVVQQLRERSVLFHKIDSVPQGIRLSVIVASRTNPEATRVYEATGPDLASAAQAILQKLDSAR
jgi:hypothetical protein